LEVGSGDEGKGWDRSLVAYTDCESIGVEVSEEVGGGVGVEGADTEFEADERNGRES